MVAKARKSVPLNLGEAIVDHTAEATAMAAKERQWAGGNKSGVGRKKVVSLELGQPVDAHATKASTMAAKATGTTRSGVERADYVRKHGIPELEVAVRGGALSIYRAAQIAEGSADRSRRCLHDFR
jgi:hypothetical protein